MTQPFDGLIFDIDGTILRGKRILPGVLEAIQALRQRALRLAFSTNDNQNTIESWLKRLGDAGIEVAPTELVTSAMVAAETTAQLYPDSKILPVGNTGLFEALETKNLNLVDFQQAEQAQVVVMGKDPAFDQARLQQVCDAIWRGAKFIATNYDPKIPVANGFIPATGAMVKAVAYATGVEPLITGKPSTWSGKIALEKLGVPASRAIMVGDQLDTDIKMGKRGGMVTALVLTGTARRADIDLAPPDQRPDAVLSDLTQLVPWLDNQ